MTFSKAKCIGCGKGEKAGPLRLEGISKGHLFFCHPVRKCFDLWAKEEEAGQTKRIKALEDQSKIPTGGK